MTKESTPDAVVDDLVQIVTHRIASLTSGLEGYTDILIETLATDEQRRLAREILAGVSRINGVVEDLRFFVRPIAAHPIPLSVGGLVMEVIAALPAEDQAMIQTEMEGGSEPLAILDPALSRQTLLALIQNAIDGAGPSGGVIVKQHSDEEYVSVRIWNAGATLTEAELARARDPFYTTKAQNLGLGLTLSRRAMEAQGGLLDIAAADDGTAVTLRFEVASALEC